MHHSTASHSQHNRRSLSALLFRGIATVLLLLGTAYPAFSAKAVKNQFSFENVEQAAKTLAAVPYQPPPPIPEALKKLDYDTWRKIRFKPDSALWGKTKSPFTLQFFHPGFLYDRTVKLNSIDAGKVAPVVVTKEMFDYSQVQELKAQLPTEIGAAGFRVHVRHRADLLLPLAQPLAPQGRQAHRQTERALHRPGHCGHFGGGGPDHRP